MKPKAPYVFTEREKREFLALVSSTKVPSGFSSTLTKHIGERWLNGLKSHDHHILLQQILHAAIRNSLNRCVRETIIRLGNLFQRICANVIRISEWQCSKNPCCSWGVVPTQDKFSSRIFWHYDSPRCTLSRRNRNVWTCSRKMVLLHWAVSWCPHKICLW